MPDALPLSDPEPAAEVTGRTVRTTCPYCGVGCGVLLTRRGDGSVAVAGDPLHPANAGRLCSKGAALGETVGLEGRLLRPMVDGRPVDWDHALDRVADSFARIVATDGPDAVAFYVSGQILTEDYYVANKLMKGFIGSANIDTNSRLCMASTVAGHRRAFGADVVPGCYEDLERADLVVLVGSNLAWCHPVLFQRIEAARACRPTMRVVVIDPRRTRTAAAADLHLPIAPDGDVALFAGLLTHLDRNGFTRRDYVEAFTAGADAALDAARIDPAEVARRCGLTEDDVTRFFDLWARTEKVVTVFSQGVNQSGRGTDNVNAILNCHLLTGRLARRGMGPFSVTGQPNAMGGREVGGLANQLAAHLTLDDPVDRDRVSTFWNAPRLASRPGLKAVDLFDRIAKGAVKAVWIMGTNPVDSVPAADAVRAGLDRRGAGRPFVVVSDVVADTDTTRVADVLLPAAAWGEKDGTVTNSERRISRQRGLLPLPGDARPDWWMLTEVARRMGFADAFPYANVADVFREYAAMTAMAAADRGRPLDLGGLAALSDADYDALAPIQWPVRETAPHAGSDRLFTDGRFATPDGRARFVPTPVDSAQDAVPTCATFPLVLNTGRIRDQWHTMTRTARSARLSQHYAEPFLEIHPTDAAGSGVVAATLVEVLSPQGTAVLRALVTPSVRPGTVFAPMHWTDRFTSRGRINAVVAPRTDPVSGQPASKNTPVAIRPAVMAWYGFAVSRAEPAPPPTDYWAMSRIDAGWRMELADGRTPTDWLALADAILGVPGQEARTATYEDAAGGHFRLARIADGRLQAVLFIAPDPVTVARTFVVDLFDVAGETDVGRLLAGRPSVDQADRGPIVCACFGVGAGEIAASARSGATSVQDIGRRLKAGTNCGSCRTEIARLLDHVAPAHAH